ncbi:MAG: hypothetical protein ACI9IA_000213 [Enterobacterales bacterium]|jgi:hypothetical protein
MSIAEPMILLIHTFCSIEITPIHTRECLVQMNSCVHEYMNEFSECADYWDEEKIEVR